MDILVVAIVAFAILEALNVIILYFAPGFQQGGNGVAVFNAWERSKADPELHAFVRYLVNWVAGTKLIFLALLVVVVTLGDQTLKQASVAALVLTIWTFYWRLFPLIRQMDKAGWITPAGYSRTLGWTIAAFLVVFAAALARSLLYPLTPEITVP